MRKFFELVSAVFIMLMFASCSSITLLRTKELHAVRDSIYVRMDSLQSRLRESQRIHEELLRSMRADQSVRFDEIGKKITEVGDGLTENQYRLSQIDDKTAIFQKQLQEKLTADSIAANSRTAEIEKLFQMASGEFASGRFDFALNGFRDVMSRFPDSPQGKESEYWAAECLSSKKEFDEAEKTFLLYIKKNQGQPESKRCLAYYKLGLVYEKKEKVKSRDLVWKKLIDQCPESDEAGQVKEKVK